MTTGVKPLTIIGSLDDMITFSDPVITPRDYLLFHKNEKYVYIECL
jgi:hypothetical protein